jgi:mitotic spindle assembly checkpoint protein MAD2B
MLESQLGPLIHNGMLPASKCIMLASVFIVDNATFAIVLELQPGKAPLATQKKVRTVSLLYTLLPLRNLTPIQGDLPPWNPAPIQHTTEGASENAELHLVRAVETGVINVSISMIPSLELA